MGEVKKRPVPPRARTRKNSELRSYFDYSSLGVEIEQDGLKEMSFGEYLVENAVLNRFQLLQALQMQDRQPGVRLGECAAALGFAPVGEIERRFNEYSGVGTVVLA